MLKDFVVKSRYYLFILLFLLLVFFLISNSSMEFILNIDGTVSHYFRNHIVSDSFTNFFKIVTNFGEVYFFIAILFIVLLLFKNRNFFSSMFFNLFFTYLVSVIFKNIFRRDRPLYSLIKKPSDFSFPSGHTMCSVAFYGFIIYLINKYVKNKLLRYFLIIICLLIIVFVGISRIYLNVHYFSDVICGGILGLVCLLMFVNYVKIKNII